MRLTQKYTKFRDMYIHVHYYVFTFSAGYECVKSQLVKIVRVLKARKAAGIALTLHYQQEGWLEVTEYPKEQELVTQALVRMKDDSSQYDKFLNMLRAIEGLDVIVNAITCGQGKSSAF